MFYFLYENIGSKLKVLATVIFIAEAIGSIITGMVLSVYSRNGVYILICICGPIVAWVSSWILYAIGQIADDVQTIRYSKTVSQNSTYPPVATDSVVEPTSDFVQIQNETNNSVQTEALLIEDQKERKEKEIKEKERNERLEQMAAYRSRGLCQHCGGEFKGLITKKCSRCGITKNY